MLQSMETSLQQPVRGEIQVQLSNESSALITEHNELPIKNAHIKSKYNYLSC